MRYRPILPTAAGALAAVHVVGILTGVPLLRQAEVAALLLLVVYALTARPRSRPWVVPLALTVLVVDAFATMPPAGTGRLQVLRSGPADLTLGFLTGLRMSWAALAFVLVLLVAMRWREARPNRLVLTGATLAAALVAGYAVLRLVEVHLAVREAQRVHPGYGGPTGVEVTAAVLAPLVVAFGTIVLAVLLAGCRRRLAASGAALLALVALSQLDAALAPLPLPSYVDRGALFTSAFHANTSVPAPGPAVAAAIELAAYLLLVVGLCAHQRPSPGTGRAG
ncbi:hypothetical protein [Micromonospora lutea]|uniref:Uncharacterized protein n=1 Tax=Micromonospora lutea TaxID=419825 RepID=A0ABQ4INW0_9ACTN|nr:hypothetical protein [Micromonospora lutea]GIJ19605.1 hypothetical protein Vlu01_02290 [Micromonospora lutea]